MGSSGIHWDPSGSSGWSDLSVPLGMSVPVCRGPSESSGSASGPSGSSGPVKVRRNDRGPSGSVASGSAGTHRVLTRSFGRVCRGLLGQAQESLGLVGVRRNRQGLSRFVEIVRVRRGPSWSVEIVGLRRPRDGWDPSGSSGWSRPDGDHRGFAGIVRACRDRQSPSRTSGSIGHPGDEFGKSCSPSQCQCAGMQKSDKMPDRKHRRRFYPAGMRH